MKFFSEFRICFLKKHFLQGLERRKDRKRVAGRSAQECEKGSGKGCREGAFRSERDDRTIRGQVTVFERPLVLQFPSYWGGLVKIFFGRLRFVFSKTCGKRARANGFESAPAIYRESEYLQLRANSDPFRKCE